MRIAETSPSARSGEAEAEEAEAAGSGGAEQDRGAGLAGDEAVRVRLGQEPVVGVVGADRVGEQEGVDAGDDGAGDGAGRDQPAGLVERDRAGDLPVGDDPARPVEAAAERLGQAGRQAVVEAVEPAGAFGLGDAEEERDLLRGEVGAGVEALAQGADEQVHQPLQPAPGGLERNLRAEDPRAVARDEAGLLEVGEPRAERGAGGRRGQADGRCHAAGLDRDLAGHAASPRGRSASVR
jgi:hypothetical protein